MSTQSATLESLVKTAAGPTVETWNTRNKQGFETQGFSKLALTNAATVDVQVHRSVAGGSTTVIPLRGRARIIVPLDANQEQFIEFKAAGGGEADGFLVLCDSATEWRLDSPDAEDNKSFTGPRSIALVNDPSSGYTAELIANGGVKDTVANGLARKISLSAAEARAITIRRDLGSTPKSETATGLLCTTLL